MSRWELLHADCRAVLANMGDESVDSVVTDPPYHLTSIVKRFGGANAAPAQYGTDGAYARAARGFMGQTWDGGDIAFDPTLWAEVLRVLKPGGHLLAFSGSRTYHRMACAIEDAGFEIRDQIMWLYGNGFPKSHDISKAIDKAAGAPATDAARQWEGWGTALKPAHEPIVMARKPLAGTVVDTVLEYGTGGLNIDGCRINVGDDASYAANCSGDRGHADNRKRDLDFAMGCGKASDIGRFPANVIHDGSDEVVAGFPMQRSGGTPPRRGPDGERNAYNAYQGGEAGNGVGPTAGNASRFFYCAKASKADRGPDNDHPTVKPEPLMRYLARLVTPPGGLIFDPFTGSGSTGKAAMLEGFRFVGAELTAEYIPIACARIAAAAGS